MTWISEMNAVWAKHVYDDLRRRGLDAEAAIRACNIRRTALSRKESMIPLEKHCALFGYAAKVTGDDCYGLNLGIKMNPKDAGLLGYIGLSSATLQDAMRNFIRYSRIMSDAIDLRLSMEDSIAILEQGTISQPFPMGYDQDAEFSVALLINGCRIFTGRDITPVKVELAHRRTRHTSVFKRVLGCPVSFGTVRERMVFKREHMLLPIVSADDRLLDVLKSYGDKILTERSRRGSDFKHQVERSIVELLPKGEATAKIVAMELGMSERTFARRLAAIGITFKELLANVRRDLSLKYVAEPDLTLKQTAFLLGYSEASAFSHAFKRWTGETPASARHAALGRLNEPSTGGIRPAR